MRINKYMALKKISTRRGADLLVTEKKVFINGKLAVLGSKVNKTDTVEIKGVKADEYKVRVVIGGTKKAIEEALSSKDVKVEMEEAISKVKILPNLVIPNLFRDLTYNALGS